MVAKLIIPKPSILGVNRCILGNLPEGYITLLGALPQDVAIIFLNDDWASMRLKNITGG
jgi:hypothetical protein